MGIVVKEMEYQSDVISCRGVVAYDDALTSSRPLVLVAHDWSGCNEFVIEKAKELAAFGLVGFAIDMYGEGRQGKTNEEKNALMQPLVQDRALLLARINAAYQAGLMLPQVDRARVGAIGFCFGGLCVLDLARSGAPLRGVVSFHGALTPPPKKLADAILASVLVLHGYQDPMVSIDAVLAFAEEMQAMKADYQIHMYGNTMHAFSNPLAHDPGFGTVYQPLSDKRAWQSMQNFFDEVF